LYGKDGVEGGHRLEITAQLDVTLELDSKCVRVPVFVQPDKQTARQNGSLGVDMVELREKQESDGELVAMVQYLKHGELPGDEKQGKKVVLESARFELIDDVLHHENPAFPGRYIVRWFQSHYASAF
jgi:hypothetical protein